MHKDKTNGAQCCQLLIAGTVLCKMDCSSQTIRVIEKIRALLLFQLLILHTRCHFWANLTESKQWKSVLNMKRHFCSFSGEIFGGNFSWNTKSGWNQLLRLRLLSYRKNKTTFTVPTFNFTYWVSFLSLLEHSLLQ